MGAPSSATTKSRSSPVGMLTRSSLCSMASTGVAGALRSWRRMLRALWDSAAQDSTQRPDCRISSYMESGSADRPHGAIRRCPDAFTWRPAQLRRSGSSCPSTRRVSGGRQDQLAARRVHEMIRSRRTGSRLRRDHPPGATGLVGGLRRLPGGSALLLGRSQAAANSRMSTCDAGSRGFFGLS